ncbi:MAG TPA: P1 family peptidase, partial [Myxococcota bacterium]
MSTKDDSSESGAAKGGADQRYEAWTTEGDPIVDEVVAGPRVRAREIAKDYKLELGMYAPGEHNAITDVKGVKVGHFTVSHGNGKLEVGKGPARTGVTAIVPPGNVFLERLAASGWVLNGAGEMTGLTQISEWGLLETPIVLTNTLAVGTASDAVVRYMIERNPGIGREHDTVLPVVGECDDSWLSDIAGRHVRDVHVLAALERAASGPVAEGTIGAGTGMITFDFAGGIGTSSRVLPTREGGFTVGALVQSNFGHGIDLRMGGARTGPEIAGHYKHVSKRGGDYGSIICIVATDAPLIAHQLHRLSKRAALGIGRTGSNAGHGSGEIILSFSTANSFPRTSSKTVLSIEMLSDEHIDPLFRAV